MKAIDALKRLERAGSEHTRTTQKLREAAHKVTCQLAETVPHDIILPRNYVVTWADGYACDEGARWHKSVVVLMRKARLVTEYGQHYFVGSVVGMASLDLGQWDVKSYFPDQSRQDVLAFSADIADGLLEEISAFVEARAAENKNATGILKASSEK